MWNPKSSPPPPPPPPPQTTQSSSPSSLPSPSSSASSWLASNERVAVDDVTPEVRLQAEMKLVSEIMNIVQRTKRQLIEYCGIQSDVMTNKEQDIFSRYTYYGYRYGIMAGMVSFTVLYGGLRYAAYRRYLLEYYLPNVSEQYHSHVVSKRQQYSVFDRQTRQPKHKHNAVSHTTTVNSGVPQKPDSATIDTIAAATATTAVVRNGTKQTIASHTTTKPSITLFSTKSNTTFAVFPNDVSVTVQFYVTSALSLLLSAFTWNYFFDWDSLHNDVSNIPLHSGPSTYCQLLCQELIHRQEQIMEGNIYIPVTTIVKKEKSNMLPKVEPTDNKNTNTNTNTTGTNNDINDTSSTPIVQIVQLSTAELWDDPISENLHRMKRLIHNCEQRTMYENECKKRQQRLIHPNHNVTNIVLVDVPEPALPLRYHSIPPSSAPQSTPGSNNDTDTSSTSPPPTTTNNTEQR